jgi:hypothetical protein
MSKQVGLDMYLYRNTGSYGTPTWVVVENVRDLNGADSMAEADVSRRGTAVTGSGFKQNEPTLREMSFDWEMVRDEADADFTALRTAYAARTLVEFAFADGAIATTGTNYFRIECKIFGFERSEPLEGPNTYKVTAKPCYSANAPLLVTV